MKDDYMFDEKWRGGLKSMVKWVIGILAALVVIAGGCIAWWLNSGERDRREGKTKDTGNRPPRTPNLRSGITREACWEKFKEISRQRKVAQHCHDVFCNTGILFYLERLLIIVRYGIPQNGWQKEREMVTYYINSQLREVLRKHMQETDEGFRIPDGKRLQPEMDEETFYYQNNLDLEKSREEMERRLEELYRQLEQEESILGRKKNTIFYRNLWNEVWPLLKDLLELGERLNQNGNDLSMEQEFTSLIEKLVGKMKECGIQFICGDEADEEQQRNYFHLSENGEENAAVVRISDQYIYYYGVTGRRV